MSTLAIRNIEPAIKDKLRLVSAAGCPSADSSSIAKCGMARILRLTQSGEAILLVCIR